MKELQEQKELAAKLSEKITEITSLPYLNQAIEAVESETEDIPSYLKKAFLSVKIPIPMKTFLKILPSFNLSLENLKAFTEKNLICAIPCTNPSTRTCTWVQLSVFDLNIQAVVDTGAPNTIVSLQLVGKIQYKSDLTYNESFKAASTHCCTAQGAYSCIPIQLGKLVVTTNTIVLESQSYGLLIGTNFFRKYQAILNMGNGSMTIMGYHIPLLFCNDASAYMVYQLLPKCSHVLIKYPHG